jgi:hypothetical protein
VTTNVFTTLMSGNTDINTVKTAIERLRTLTFLAERLRTLKINIELTTDLKKIPKNDTIENKFMYNVAIVCHIIYLTFEKFSIHTINILEKSHKLIIIIVYK